MSEQDVQRSLGKIEGTQTQILSELRQFRADLAKHQADDVLIAKALDTRIDALKEDADRAKGAGKVIITAFLGLAGFVGGAVLSVLNGWIKIST